MARGESYKSIVRQVVEHAKKLETFEQFQDSFSKNQP